MEPNAFVAELYRRMSLHRKSAVSMPSDARLEEVAQEYRRFLPGDKSAPILDLGLGDGWFIAACAKLGYSNLHGADFGISTRRYLETIGVRLHQINRDIGDFLATQPDSYQFIHLSHVIEHIPKYSILWVVDAMYRALQRGGMIFLRTPNMESPAALSSLFVTLAHEYGFCGSNLRSILEICGFEDVRLYQGMAAHTLKQRLGAVFRSPYMLERRLRNRLFGVNVGGKYGIELIATGIRGEAPPLFDEKYR